MSIKKSNTRIALSLPTNILNLIQGALTAPGLLSITKGAPSELFEQLAIAYLERIYSTDIHTLKEVSNKVGCVRDVLIGVLAERKNAE